MPKVEQYRPNQVSTQIIAAPVNPLKAEASPLASIAEGALKGAALISERVETVKAEEAVIGFERAKNDLFHNADSGYFNKAGVHAYEGASDVNDALAKLAKDHGSKLTSPTARAAFDKVAQNHITRGQLEIQNHARKGLDAHEKATSAAAVENTFENASLNWGDETELAVQRQIGRTELTAVLEKDGITGEAQTERLETYDSKFAATAIAAATQSSAATGKAAMEQYGDLLEGPDKLKMDKLIEDKEKADKTQNTAAISITAGRSIASQYYDLGGFDAARAEVDRRFKDPEVNKAVTRELTAEFRRNDYAKTRQRSEAFDSAEEYMLGGTPGQPRTVEGFKAANPEAWEAMSNKNKRYLESGKITITSEAVLNEIGTLSMDELAKLDVSKHDSSLSTADRKGVRTMVKNAREGKHDSDLQTRSAFIKAKLNNYSLNDEDTQTVMQEIQIELDKAVTAKKGKLSRKDEQNIITNSVSNFEIQNSMWFNDNYSPKNTPIRDLRAMNLLSKQISAKIPSESANSINKKIAALRDSMTDDGVAVDYRSLLGAYLTRYPIKKR